MTEGALGQRQPRLGRVLLTFVLAIVFLEVGARTLVRVWAGRPYQSLSPYIWSPYGLVRNNPKLTSPQFQIDGQGFRDLKEYRHPKPPNTLRIMILGGSTMYSGLGRVTLRNVQRVDSSSTLAQYLEADLRRDPAFANVRVEVMNAAVNFSRILEVSTAYLTEWVFWEPDVVIVGGSANNFAYFLPRGGFEQRSAGITSDHPWRMEFERIANDRGFVSLLERGVLTLEGRSALVALARKGVSKGLDVAFARTRELSSRLGVVEQGRSAPVEAASWQEYDRYVDEYLGYADAMVAAAHLHHQEIAFFWEYLLQSVGDLKPLSEEEKRLYAANRQATWKLDTAYDFRARDRVATLCRERGAVFIDPLDDLRTSRETVYIDYLHYTREGNRFMAGVVHRVLADVLRRRAGEIASRNAPAR